MCCQCLLFYFILGGKGVACNVNTQVSLKSMLMLPHFICCMQSALDEFIDEGGAFWVHLQRTALEDMPAKNLNLSK